MSIGSQLARAELFSQDEHGKRIPKVERSWWVTPCKETPRHAMSDAGTLVSEEQQENERMEREARRMFDALSDFDRELLRLSEVALGPCERKVPFPLAWKQRMLDEGWLFVKREGGHVVMARVFQGRLTHGAIAHHLGITVAEVRRRLNAISPMLVKYAVMRGWI